MKTIECYANYFIQYQKVETLGIYPIQNIKIVIVTLFIQ